MEHNVATPNSSVNNKINIIKSSGEKVILIQYNFLNFKKRNKTPYFRLKIKFKDGLR